MKTTTLATLLKNFLMNIYSALVKGSDSDLTFDANVSESC